MINFVVRNADMPVGSYRIWVYDLSMNLSKIGVKTVINEPITNETKVIILGKDSINSVSKYKVNYPNVKIGIINPSVVDMNADFIIAGSLEEVASFGRHPNVFYVPLIENLYMGHKLKTHDNNGLVIGFHGHFAHLSKMHGHLQSALECFEREQPFKLKIVTGEDRDWLYGRPNLKNIEIVQWNIANVVRHMYECDIGVVPNITDIKPDRFKVDPTIGLYDTDYFLRMKHKSNAGRAFVFVQLGIPVVADLTPSHFHLFGDPKCGHIVYNKEGWLKAFRHLSESKNRNVMAKAANEEFNRLYDPLDWANRLNDSIRNM